MGSRELPCPFRIVDDFGGAFSMGCFAGCILYFIRGMWYSPKKERLYGGYISKFYYHNINKGHVNEKKSTCFRWFICTLGGTL